MSSPLGRRRLSLACEPLESRTVMSTVGPVATRLLVGFPAGPLGAEARQLVARLDAEVARTAPGAPAIVRLTPGTVVENARAQFAALPGVRYAEVNRTVAVQAIPNDTSFAQLWGLNTTTDADVDAPQAWDVTAGSPSVLVAVVDSGVDVRHPDLASQIWTNPGEIPGNRRDDDRNGYVDDTSGWNFITNTASVRDDDSHGTHVAGIIAAARNNGQGVAGVAPGVRLMPLKFIGGDGLGDIADAVRAIIYAANQGARVINASWSGPDDSPGLADAIRYAGTKGAVVVAAAGNDSLNLDRYPSYPASYRADNLLTVAAVDSSGNLADFSNYGTAAVDVAAPGVSILSTIPGGRYTRMSGTSMAAPHVAGIAALVASRNPELSAAQIADRVRDTAKPNASLAGRMAAPGIASAYRAVANLSRSAVSPAATSLSYDDVRRLILASNEYNQIRGATPEAFVVGLFKDILARSPSQSLDRQPWVDAIKNGTSRDFVVRALMDSQEGRQTQVARWFKTYLRRRASVDIIKNDPVVVSMASQLSSGVPPREILLTILSSDEYYTKAGGTNSAYVERLYQDLLRRSYGPGLATSGWVQDLNGGAPRVDVARGILTSLESRLALVAYWYQEYLRRPQTIAVLKANADVKNWAQNLVI